MKNFKPEIVKIIKISLKVIYTKIKHFAQKVLVRRRKLHVEIFLFFRTILLCGIVLI